MNPMCPYCGNPSEKVTGKEVYPHRRDLWGKQFYRCEPCQAWVGCHGASDKPLGRLANAELRTAKMKAHAAFDRLWMGAGPYSRGKAYHLLANALGISKEECHIGMFDVETCYKVERIAERLALR